MEQFPCQTEMLEAFHVFALPMFLYSSGMLEPSATTLSQESSF